MSRCRPTISRFFAGNTFLAVLALWGFVTFDAAHIIHHLHDDDAPLSNEVGSHSWWDGILFHTGTVPEPLFTASVPNNPFVERLHAEAPESGHGTPLLVRESRAPPVA